MDGYNKINLSNDTQNDEQSLISPKKETTEYVLYRRRWFVMVAQFFLNWLQTISSVCISALTKQISDAFETPQYEVNLAVSCSAAVFLPAFIVSTLLFNRFESRTVLSIAATIMICGAWIRSVAQINDNFWWVVVGQAVIASSGPMVTSSISIIANNWFSDKERALATSIMSLSNPFGSFMSFVI